MNWLEWLKSNLRPDQLERLDAYDVQILEAIRRRTKQLKTENRKVKVGVTGIYSAVHAEMGGITEAQLYERLRKLSDMALIRVYATFNRNMEGML